MTNLTPTDEQSSILDFIRSSTSNLMIRALAGTGKSATLKMVDAATLHRPCLYLVFNKNNAVAAEKSGEFSSSTTIRTFNSLGHRIWADYCSKKVVFSPRKINDIFRAIVEDEDRSTATEYWLNYDSVCAGVNLARAIGYIPDAHSREGKRICNFTMLAGLLDENPNETTRYLIDRILLESIRQAYSGIIDFPDQCYMPALFGGFYPRFPLNLIDEYQDLSPVQHVMVEKLTKGGRLIGVGDEAQSIYGFRGAKAGGMAQAIDKFEMEVMPLSISFRCPSRIVENVHWRVPEFKASREGGRVETRTDGLLWEGSTVICRNNAPLIAKAMACLAAGVSVNVSGTDIGARLIRTMTKLGSETMTQTQTLSAIDDWLYLKLAADSKSALDTADCMRVFAAKSPSLGAAIAYAKHMFEQSGTINFVTGHKSKGMEWDYVYHLEPGLCSTKGQDPNIRYVADTRAKEILTYI